MDCVRCGGEMDKRPERGVLLDHCPACNAIWLDGGELAALEAGHRSSESAIAAQREAELERDAERSVTAIGLCPRCQRQLHPAAIRGVEVDRCENCAGVFFDHGELPAILRNRRLSPLATRRRRPSHGP